MKTRTVLVLTVLLTCVSGVTHADPLADGLQALKAGNYKKAEPILRALAVQGNGVAEDKIGQMCFYGKGVPQSYINALKWYRKSADQGNADAQVRLGFMYDSGAGVPLDHKAAAKWYRKAADQNNTSAQIMLGVKHPRQFEPF